MITGKHCKIAINYVNGKTIEKDRNVNTYGYGTLEKDMIWKQSINVDDITKKYHRR